MALMSCYENVLERCGRTYDICLTASSPIKMRYVAVCSKVSFTRNSPLTPSTRGKRGNLTLLILRKHNKDGGSSFSNFAFFLFRLFFWCLLAYGCNSFDCFMRLLGGLGRQSFTGWPACDLTIPVFETRKCHFGRISISSSFTSWEMLMSSLV